MSKISTSLTQFFTRMEGVEADTYDEAIYVANKALAKLQDNKEVTYSISAFQHTVSNARHYLTFTYTWMVIQNATPTPAEAYEEENIFGDEDEKFKF